MQRIAIHGVPRSGTTWLGEIINSSPFTVYKFQPLFSFALKGYLSPSSESVDIASFYRKLLETKDVFLDQQDSRVAGKLPIFEKSTTTHVAYKEVRYHNILKNLVAKAGRDFRLLLIVRNPLAVMSSWLSAPKEFRKDLGWSVSDEWRFAPRKNCNKAEEFNGYEKWKEATTLFKSLKISSPDRVMLVNYHDLVNDTYATVEKIFAFCSLDLTAQTEKFLESSKQSSVNDPYSVFCNSDTELKWRTNLEPSIIEEILNDLRGTDLEEYV